MSMRRIYIALLATFILLGLAGGISAAPVPERHRQPPLPDGAVLRLGSSFLTPGRPIYGLAAMPDSRHVVAADSQSITVWDLHSGQSVKSVLHGMKLGLIRSTSHKNGLLSVSPDGKKLAFQTGTGVHLYDLPLTGAVVRPLTKNRRFGAIHFEATAVTSKAAVSLSLQGKLYEMDLSNGPAVTDMVAVDVPSVNRANALGWRHSLAAGADLVAFAGPRGKEVQVWDSSKYKSIGPLLLEQGVAALAISGDGKWLAVSTTRQLTNEKGAYSIEVFSLPDLKRKGKWEKSANLLNTANLLAMSHDGALIAAVRQYDYKIDVFQSSDGKALYTLDLVNDWIDCIDFLPDGSGFVAAGGGRTGSAAISTIIHYWDAKTGKSLRPPGHSSPIASIHFLPQGGYVSAGRDGSLRHWNDRGDTEKAVMAIPNGLASMVISPDGKTMFLAGKTPKSALRSWDVGTLAEKRKGVLGSLLSWSDSVMSLSPDGKTIALAVSRQDIHLLDSSTLKLKKVLKIAPPAGGSGDGNPIAVAFAFAGNDRLVSLDFLNYLRIWDLPRNVELKQAKSLLKFGPGLAVSPDGKRFAVQDGNKVLIWDVEKCEQMTEIVLPTIESLRDIAYLSNTRIAVGDARGRIWLVDIDKKSQPKMLEGHQGPITCLAVSPDGKHFASGSADTTVLIWKIQP